MASTCIRCQPSVGGDPRNLGKCDPDIKKQLDLTLGAITRVWGKGRNPGDRNDDPGDLQQSNFLLKNLSTVQEHNGRPVTKWMLENAYRKVYPYKSGENQAEKERNQRSTQAAPQTARTTKSTSKSHQMFAKGYTTGKSSQIYSKSAGGGGETGQVLPKKNAFHQADFLTLPKSTYVQNYDFAVHQTCELDTSLDSPASQPGRTGTTGKPLKVATIYIAVSKTPLKLCMYSIEYGTITPVKTEKQIQDDKESSSEAQQASNVIATALSETVQGLSIGDDDSNAQNISAAADTAEGRKVGQRSEKARIFKALGQRTPLNHVVFATDYDNLWTLQPLQGDQSGSCNIGRVRYTKLSGRPYELDTITFAYQRDLDIDPVPAKASEFLINQQPLTKKGGSMLVTALNALISRHVSLNSEALISIGTNKFFPKTGYVSAGQMLNTHRGYFTSIRPGQHSILLNVNVATSAFYQPMNVAEFYSMIENSFSGYGEPEALLKGLIVRISYDREQHDAEYDPNNKDNRYRTIAGFGEKPSDQKFELEGQPITVAQYFKEKLGAADLRAPSLPCINVTIAPKQHEHYNAKQSGDQEGREGKGKSKVQKQQDDKKVQPQWIPPEYLQIKPHQPFKKLLLHQRTEKMISTALRHPAKNQNLIITEGFRHLGIGQNHDNFSSLQLSLGDKLLQIPARRLAAPRIVYGGNREANVIEASWNLFGKRFFTTPGSAGKVKYPLQKAVCTIDMRSEESKWIPTNQGLELSKAMMTYGIQFNPRPADTHKYCDIFERMKDTDWSDYTFYSTMGKALAEMGNPQLLLVLLSTRSQPYYALIKRVCDQYLGVHTVCLVEDKLFDKYDNFEGITDQQAGNLALKFNLKLGGQNHRICKLENKQYVSAFQDIANDTIVFGADVTHPSGGMPNAPSIAAVVASYDKEFAHFSASMRLQASTQETIEEMEDMVYRRLAHFGKTHGRLPARIIFYRDGIGEDQFRKCRQSEIVSIRRAYDKAVRNAPPGYNGPRGMKLVFIVVGKRHHIRFFACNEDDTYGDKNGQVAVQKPYKLNGNLQPGLIVDEVITRPPADETFDFFLQSHAALKGTARSAHYSVLERGDLSVDQIQEITHAFCYKYMRATKGVSYAGPAYYADRLCDRGAQYLRACQMPSMEMNQAEQDMEKPKGQQAFTNRVAEEYSKTKAWNPRYGSAQYAGREANPWHPNFDNCMFWL